MTNYLNFTTTGDLDQDICRYFEEFGNPETFSHTLNVIEELKYIEEMYGTVESGSYTACLCHDLGRVVRREDVFDFCAENDVPFTDEERQMPSILHPKISCVIAHRVFGITDDKILDAIRYHSTSRKNPSMIEIEVLLADKMSWKEYPESELSRKIKDSLKISKHFALYYYLRDLFENRESLELYHTNAWEAYGYYKENYFDRNTGDCIS